MVSPVSLMDSIQPHLVVILISADAEWAVVKSKLQGVTIRSSPFGEWFQKTVALETTQISQDHDDTPDSVKVIFFQGGWGKISAAASAQYVIDTFRPELLVNFGTCGGIHNQVERLDIILVVETIVYDIYEQMGDPFEHIAHYSTKIDLSWLAQAPPPPLPIKRGILASGDRDLFPGEIDELRKRYHASAGDWESGAIAFTARMNNQPLVIIRGVTDLVDNQTGEAYADPKIFLENTEIVMDLLITRFSVWVLSCFF